MPTLVADIGKAKYLSPHLGQLLASMRLLSGQPRAAMTVPIAPAAELRDVMAFESPSNPAERYYLPRYRLATATTDRGTQFKLHLHRQDPGTRLSVVLEPYRPPELGAAGPSAQPIEHQVTALLQFKIPGSGGMERELRLQDARAVEGGIELSLTVATLEGRNELYNALTLTEASTKLIVRRTLTVAVPVPAAPQGFGVPPPPSATLAPRPARLQPVQEAPAELVRDRRSAATPAPMQALDRSLLPQGAVPIANHQRILNQQDGPIARPLPRPPAPQPPAREPPAPLPPVQPPEPLFRATTRSVDQATLPFNFVPELFPYVFGDIRAGGGQGGMLLEQIPFDGNFHSYYYQADRPEQVYFLPDAFRLARIPQRPSSPFMSVVFDSKDGVLETTTATVQFAASPVVSAARLRAAESKLLTSLAGPPAGADRRLELVPLQVESQRLSLLAYLPGSASNATEGLTAYIDLRAGLQAGFKLLVPQFQALFDRLQGPDPSLLYGHVEVRLDRPDRPAEQIPLLVRMDDLAGAPLDVTVPVPAGPGAWTFSVTNAIESPLDVSGLRMTWPSLEAAPGDTIVGLPADGRLPAGASLELKAAMRTLPKRPEDVPGLDMDPARAVPDPTAIWEAVCQDTSSSLSRKIVVKTPPLMFQSTDGAPPVVALVVELASPVGGLPKTVELSPLALEQSASLAVPIADLVLRTEDPGAYRYRVSTVRSDRVVEGDWKTKSSDILWIVTGDVA